MLIREPKLSERPSKSSNVDRPPARRRVNPRKLCTKFREACIRYLTKYGILNYNFYFECRELDDAAAQVQYDTGEKHQATFSIDVESRLDDVDSLAKHEVLELLLADLGSMASEMYCDNIVNKELHRVIYAIVNAEEKK